MQAASGFPFAGRRGAVGAGCARRRAPGGRGVREAVQAAGVDSMSLPKRGRTFLQQVDDRFNAVLRAGQESAENLLRREASMVEPASEDEVQRLLQDESVDGVTVDLGRAQAGASSPWGAGEGGSGVLGVLSSRAYQGPTDGWGTYDLELRGETAGYGSTLAAEVPPRRLLLRMSTAQGGGGVAAQLWGGRSTRPGLVTDQPIPFLLYDVTEANLARVFGVKDAWLRDNQGLAYFPDSSGNFHLEEDAARTEHENWMIIGSGPWEVRGTPVWVQAGAGEQYTSGVSSAPAVSRPRQAKPSTSLGVVLWAGTLAAALYVYTLWVRAKDVRSVSKADGDLAAALAEK